MWELGEADVGPTGDTVVFTGKTNAFQNTGVGPSLACGVNCSGTYKLVNGQLTRRGRLLEPVGQQDRSARGHGDLQLRLHTASKRHRHDRHTPLPSAAGQREAAGSGLDQTQTRLPSAALKAIRGALATHRHPRAEIDVTGTFTNGTVSKKYSFSVKH